MVSTPQRNQLNTSVFSPVRVIDPNTSPAAAAKPDALGLRQRTKTILKAVLENHTKWLAVQRRGSALCAQIEAIKQQALDACRADADSSAYPDELRSPCSKFRVICTILDDVLAAAGDAERQLLAIERMQAGSAATAAATTAVFKTWPLARLRQCVAQLRAAYELELPVRRRCMQEIAHARTREELVLHTCVWDYPCHVNAGQLLVAVRSLRHECDLEEVPAQTAPSTAPSKRDRH